MVDSWNRHSKRRESPAPIFEHVRGARQVRVLNCQNVDGRWLSFAIPIHVGGYPLFFFSLRFILGLLEYQGSLCVIFACGEQAHDTEELVQTSLYDSPHS